VVASVVVVSIGGSSTDVAVPHAVASIVTPRRAATVRLRVTELMVMEFLSRGRETRLTGPPRED